MKVKFDFVTNSSSSSFVVMGSNISEDDVPKDMIKEALEKHGLNIEDDKYEVLENCIEELIKGSQLDYSYGSPYDDDNIMVGIHYTNMKDNETLAQFKERVQLQILECFGVAKTPGHIEECWEDR